MRREEFDKVIKDDIANMTDADFSEFEKSLWSKDMVSEEDFEKLEDIANKIRNKEEGLSRYYLVNECYHMMGALSNKNDCQHISLTTARDFCEIYFSDIFKK